MHKLNEYLGGIEKPQITKTRRIAREIHYAVDSLNVYFFCRQEEGAVRLRNTRRCPPQLWIQKYPRRTPGLGKWGLLQVLEPGFAVTYQPMTCQHHRYDHHHWHVPAATLLFAAPSMAATLRDR